MRSEYDLLGRVTSVTEIYGGSPGAKTTIAYDGLLVTTVDAAGSEKLSEYDTMGRLARAIDVLLPTGVPSVGGTAPPLGSERELRTIYTYGPFGELESVTDPRSNRTRFEYDVLGRRSALVGPRGDRTEWQYDAFGNVRYEIDAAHRIREMAHDAAGRTIAEKSADGTVCLTYDAAPNGIGKLTSAVRYDAGVNVTQSMSFDLLGRPTVTRQTVGDGPELTVEQKYDGR